MCVACTATNSVICGNMALRNKGKVTTVTTLLLLGLTIVGFIRYRYSKRKVNTHRQPYLALSYELTSNKSSAEKSHVQPGESKVSGGLVEPRPDFKAMLRFSPELKPDKPSAGKIIPSKVNVSKSLLKKMPVYENAAMACPKKALWGSFCTARLSDKDRHRAEDCLQIMENQLHLTHDELTPYIPCSCRLLKKPLRGRALLVSLPGSGNTWVRTMLERVTGVCTGSLSCDPSLRVRGMCGENVVSPLLLVVKSHSHEVVWSLPSEKESKEEATFYVDAVIFVHRDPYAAIVAERHRAASDQHRYSVKTNPHITHVGSEAFG